MHEYRFCDADRAAVIWCRDLRYGLWRACDSADLARRRQRRASLSANPDRRACDSAGDAVVAMMPERPAPPYGRKHRALLKQLFDSPDYTVSVSTLRDARPARTRSRIAELEKYGWVCREELLRAPTLPPRPIRYEHRYRLTAAGQKAMYYRGHRRAVAAVRSAERVEITATNKAEFAALLAAIGRASGKKLESIRAASGVPISTIHRWIKYGSFPRHAESVERYCHACSLGRTEVRAVMDLWRTLSMPDADRRRASYSLNGQCVPVCRIAHRAWFPPVQTVILPSLSGAPRSLLGRTLQVIKASLWSAPLGRGAAARRTHTRSGYGEPVVLELVDGVGFDVHDPAPSGLVPFLSSVGHIP